MTKLRAGILGLVAAGVLTASASAAGGTAVRIAAVDTSGFPFIRATVLAPRGSTTVRLRENGRQAAGLTATNLGKSKAIEVVVDRSESMRGRPLANAIDAAKTFVSSTGADDHVGVVIFGRNAITLTHGETGSSDARSALADVTVDTRSGTALYDAIFDAAGQLRADIRPGRAIVVITDGKDVSSLHSLADAVRAAQAAHASVYTIGIGGPSFTPDQLREIATADRRHLSPGVKRDRTMPRSTRRSNVSWLGPGRSATTPRPGPATRCICTRAFPGAGTATKAVPIPRSSDSSADTSPSSLIPSFGYSSAGTLAISILAGLLVLLACRFWFAARQGSWVKARLEPHLGVVREAGKTRRRQNRTATRTQVVDGIEGIFANLKQFRAVQAMIQRADLPLRAGELISICAGAAFVVGLVLAVATASPLAGLIGIGVGFSASSALRSLQGDSSPEAIREPAAGSADHGRRLAQGGPFVPTGHPVGRRRGRRAGGEGVQAGLDRDATR